MRTIIVMQGPPASGKSTFAKELYNSNPEKYIIVCRDSIRESRGQYCVPSQEDFITAVEEFEVIEALKRGFTPIVDATNLNPKTIVKWNKLAKDNDAKIEYKAFYVPFKTALERDSKRVRPVGEKVLKRFYLKYFEAQFREEEYVDKRVMIDNPDLPKCVLCDLDGTLAIHTSGRGSFEYERCEEDTLNISLHRTLQSLSNDVKIIFLSGREEGAGQDSLSREHTIKWLESNNYKSPTLYMRKHGDFRSDDIIKAELYENYIKNKYNVIGIYDDRNKVVDMWRKLGLPCYQVYYGNF